MVACACLPAGVPFHAAGQEGHIGRTGNKQVKDNAKVSSQTSPQVVEAAAEAVAEAEAPAEGAEQAYCMLRVEGEVAYADITKG